MQHNQQRKHGVLIVDDEPQVAAALSDLLEGQYRVITQTSAQEALKVLAEDKGISVIISDQRMPEMTGDEMFAKARELSLATRILITAYADISAVIDAVNQGRIFGYVTKPWEPSELIMTVARAADNCELNRKVLREQRLLHQLMESSIDAIAIKDRNHRFVKVNGQAARMLGAERANDVEGRFDTDFMAPERSDIRRCREDTVLDKGMPLRDAVEQVPAGDGHVAWYSSHLTPIVDLNGDVNGLVAITRDITESKRLDMMKDQFIATISHELRTPLTAIRGALDLLRDDSDGKSGIHAKRLMDIGYNNCTRLVQLVGDLLDTVALEKGEMEFDLAPVGIRDILQQAAAAAARQAEIKGVTLLVDRDPADVVVEADRDRTQQAFSKLVENAIEMTPSGKAISLDARMAGEGWVRLSVFDEGPGVPSQFHSRVFARFSQADSSSTRGKGGVGLGLHVAKAIVEAQQGKIGFENRSTAGAEFYIELPIGAAVRRQAESSAEAPSWASTVR